MIRHGYDRGCWCDNCRAAKARYANVRRLAILRGQPFTVDGTGTRRRLQALHRVGWSSQEIGDRLGVTRIAVNNLMRREGPVRRSTAERIAALYDQMWDQVPPVRTGKAAGVRPRDMARAAALGWALPMQWDDETIDDPDETPWTDDPRGAHVPGHGVVNRDSLTDCAEWGMTVREAAHRLGVSREAIEVGVTRHAPELRARFARNLAAKGVAA